MSESQVEGQDEGQEVVEQVEDKTTDEQLPQVSAAEAKALQKGWQTKENTWYRSETS